MKQLRPIMGARRHIGPCAVLFIFSMVFGCDDREQQVRMMSDSKRAERKDTVRFHQTVEKGSSEELKEALKNGADVNSAGHIQRTALMVATDARDLEKMKLLVDHGADPELTDEFNATALRHAVQSDFADGVQYLLSLGVDRGFHPKYPLKKVHYDLSLAEVKMPEGLRDVMSEEEWKESVEDAREAMFEWGQDPTVEPMISEVQSVDVLRLFFEAGDDLNLAPNEVRRAFIGMSSEAVFQSSLKDYRRHKSPRYGTRNPARMDNPFWSDMVRLGFDAYSARQHFNDSDPCSDSGVVWCYDRFGSSLTQLPDGRFVQIGGEHEDFYDPDFCIYNDVVIHDGKGSFQIYGYPREVFPPTDFHTATLVGDWIYIIGCLGYAEQREAGRTPIFRLKLESWQVEAVQASGNMPSWLHRHRSTYEQERHVIRVGDGHLQVVGDDGDLETIPNEEQFELDLSAFLWRKLK